MTTIRLLDARRGLNLKCRELFRDEKIADAIYRYLCDGIEECEDAEPKRKTGEWVEVHGFCTPGGDPVWQCSVCGKGRHVYGIEHGTYAADVSDWQWVACPNCGAVMETRNGF